MHNSEAGPPGENSRLYIYTSLTRCVASMVSPDGAVDSMLYYVGSSPAV